MIATFRLMIAFLPAPIQVMVIAIVALLLLIIIFRLIRMVLDAIPFL